MSVAPSGDRVPPVVVLVVGMAGSGKSTLMQRLTSHLHMSGRPPYTVNLDPAVIGSLKYPARVDLRQAISYKKVMETYGLGPNGAILTCLNLFGARMDELLGLLDAHTERDLSCDTVLVDTPGQIEVFTWSASGSLVTQLLASQYPTCMLFVVDGARARASPGTFMSNMLYACSILYRTQLPLVVAFNKSDAVEDVAIVKQWMSDPMSFQEALRQETSSNPRSGFYGDLTYSLSLVLDRFYETIHSCVCSAVTGHGLDELVQILHSTRDEYQKNYVQIMERRFQRDLDKVRADLQKPSADD